jgi:hypothetical protein
MNPFNELTQATSVLQRAMDRLEIERRAARRVNGRLQAVRSGNRAIAEAALVREPIPGGRGAEFWITYHPGRQEFLEIRERMPELYETLKVCDPDALNGYVAFPKRSAPRVPKNTTGNIVQYIPVHGGITWARKDSFMAVWGFDTVHWRSEHQPRTDRDWIRANCWILYRGLVLAGSLWPEFRRASQQRRAELAQQVIDLVEEQPLSENLGFEALINTLIGRVG